METTNTYAWVNDLEHSLASAASPALAGEAFWGLTWARLVVVVAVLIVVAGIDLLLRGFVRHHQRRAHARSKTTEAPVSKHDWLASTLDAAVPPLGLLVWVIGLSVAASLFFSALRFPQLANAAVPSIIWLRNFGQLAALIWFLVRWTRVIDMILRSLAARTKGKWDDILAALAGRALRLVVPLIGLVLGVPVLTASWRSHDFLKQALGLLLIGAITYIVLQLLNTLETAVLAEYRIDVRDNLEARKIQTQVKVLKRVAIVVVAVFALSSMLMEFDSVRHLGASILASAGIAGIVVGFAAQRSLSTLLAGFQLAITQPIRLDDVVIVESEWGRIEEITLTYVVVRIWDLRRLVLPATYFIEKPFQNWTRVSADLLGTVFLYLDYTVPIDAIRRELDRILAGSKLWDGKVKGVQVTDAKEKTIEVRILVSAADASNQWDLRCEVREKLLDFLHTNFPQSLPQVRAVVARNGLRANRNNFEVAAIRESAVE